MIDTHDIHEAELEIRHLTILFSKLLFIKRSTFSIWGHTEMSDDKNLTKGVILAELH